MKEALFYVGSISAVGYLMVIIGKQVYEADKFKNWRQSAQAEFESAKHEMDLVRRDQLAIITQVYGNEVAEAVANGLIYEKMPVSLLLASMGQPDKIQDGNYKGIMTSKWFYDESTNRLGNASYGFEVTLENYKIVGWRDLK